MTRIDNEVIEKLRAHLAKHADRPAVMVSTKGLLALFIQRDALKAQIERLIASKSKEIEKAIGERHEQTR